MCWRFSLALCLPLCLVLLAPCGTAHAEASKAREDNAAAEAAGLPAARCHFALYRPGEALFADPVKRSAEFIVNNWPQVEEAIAAGDGEALAHLRELSRCPYDLPPRYWQQTLRGTPYEARMVRFVNDFSARCFCPS